MNDTKTNYRTEKEKVLNEIFQNDPQGILDDEILTYIK